MLPTGSGSAPAHSFRSISGCTPPSRELLWHAALRCVALLWLSCRRVLYRCIALPSFATAPPCLQVW